MATPSLPSPQTVARPWPMAALLGAAFLTLLLLSALAAAFVGAHWSAASDNARAEAELVARASRDAAAVRALLDERQRLLALVAVQPQWRVALIDAAAAVRVAASIRGVWADAPAIAWIDERGHVVAGGGELRAGAVISGRRWFDEAVRGPLLSDESSYELSGSPGVLLAVQPLRDAAEGLSGVIVSSISCEAIAARLLSDAMPEGATWALVGRDG